MVLVERVACSGVGTFVGRSFGSDMTGLGRDCADARKCRTIPEVPYDNRGVPKPEYRKVGRSEPHDRQARRGPIVGPDVDLAVDVVLDSRGIRIDDAYAERVIVRARGGRPRLPGTTDGPSPKLEFRISPALRENVQARAEAEDKKVSEVAREALERHVG